MNAARMPAINRILGSSPVARRPPAGFRSQSEDVQHRGRRRVLELGGERNDVVRLPRADQHRDVLPAVHRVGDGRRVDPTAGIEAPYRLERRRIVSAERAVDLAEEDKIAGGRQRSRIARIIEPQARLRFARGRIDGFESTVERAVRSLEGTAGEALARGHLAALVVAILLLDRLNEAAALDRWDIDESELRIVGAGLPVLAAGNRWAQPIARRPRPAAMASRRVDLHIDIGIIVERLAGLGVEA